MWRLPVFVSFTALLQCIAERVQLGPTATPCNKQDELRWMENAVVAADFAELTVNIGWSAGGIVRWVPKLVKSKAPETSPECQPCVSILVACGVDACLRRCMLGTTLADCHICGLESKCKQKFLECSGSKYPSMSPTEAAHIRALGAPEKAFEMYGEGFYVDRLPGLKLPQDDKEVDYDVPLTEEEKQKVRKEYAELLPKFLPSPAEGGLKGILAAFTGGHMADFYHYQEEKGRLKQAKEEEKKGKSVEDPTNPTPGDTGASSIDTGSSSIDTGASSHLSLGSSSIGSESSDSEHLAARASHAHSSASQGSVASIGGTAQVSTDASTSDKARHPERSARHPEGSRESTKGGFFDAGAIESVRTLFAESFPQNQQSSAEVESLIPDPQGRELGSANSQTLAGLQTVDSSSCNSGSGSCDLAMTENSRISFLTKFVSEVSTRLAVGLQSATTRVDIASLTHLLFWLTVALMSLWKLTADYETDTL